MSNNTFHFRQKDRDQFVLSTKHHVSLSSNTTIRFSLKHERQRYSLGLRWIRCCKSETGLVILVDCWLDHRFRILLQMQGCCHFVQHNTKRPQRGKGSKQTERKLVLIVGLCYSIIVCWTGTSTKGNHETGSIFDRVGIVRVRATEYPSKVTVGIAVKG